MIYIGIDPSINCTGICVSIDKSNRYYMITSKMTKKMSNFKHNYIKIIEYIKKDTKNQEYPEKELIKTNNIVNICKCIESVLDKYISDDSIYVYMEGVSYGSTGSAALVDLSGLNFCIRQLLINKGIKFTIVSPTSLKKFACANGQAEKDIIIDAWKRLDPNIKNVKDIKIDDLADSYFLAHYNNI